MIISRKFKTWWYFLNASAGHWKHYGGPLIAHPCPGPIHLWGPSHIVRRKWKSSNKFAKSQKSRYWRSKSTVNKKIVNLYVSVVVYAENLWAVFIQWHMVVICIWYALLVKSQFDVIFMFPNQHFGKVRWHNMHLLLHALHSFYVLLHWIETISTPS